MTLGPMAQTGFSADLSTNLWGAGFAVVGLGVFSTAIAYLVYFRLLAEIGVVNTSLVSFLVPISALVLSTTLLGERLDAPAVAGMCLILAGLAVLDGRLWKNVKKSRN
ncbi:MAG: DMT family transporter, partial [Cyanobacteria bacterium J06632_3]